MSERVTVYCDQCGIDKGEGDNWHTAVTFADHQLKAGISDPAPAVLVIGDNGSARVAGTYPNVMDFCGIECILKYTSKFLGE